MSVESITFFQTNAHIVRDVISHSFASLTFMVWDIMLTFGDEVEYIWGIPWKSKTKWLYMYLRYVALAAHTAFSIEIFHLTSGYAAASTCRAWTIFQWIIIQLNLTSFQSLLALCAYALCNKSRRVALLSLALMVVQFILMGLNARRQVTEVSFETECVLVHLPSTDLATAIVVFTTFSVFICIIILKSFLAIRSGSGRTPLVSLLIKEATTIYGFVIAYFAIVFIVIIQGDGRALSLFTWAVSISSSCGCRLIMSLERLGRKLETQPLDPVITSEIEL